MTSHVCVVVGMTLVAPPYFHILSLIIFLGCIIFLSPFVDVIEALKQLVLFPFLVVLLNSLHTEYFLLMYDLTCYNSETHSQAAYLYSC